jgi:predicted ATPase
LVEREAVLTHLHAALVQARQGMRQVVFLTGEPGIGKTMVVEAFLAQAVAETSVWVAHGQCVEHYGTGEAYLPVLEALGELCRAPEKAHVITVLRQQAPTWLAQMPWLLTATDRALLQQELQGVTRERMLRECAELVDTLTAETPLILVLEDLHWSDYATMDLVALLARRQQPARLMVLGTYRSVDAGGRGHPLHTITQDLRQRQLCSELPLTLLSAAGVEAYLALRFPAQQLPAALVVWLHQYTDGNPLFLVTMMQMLVERGFLEEHQGRWELSGALETVTVEVPEGLKPLLEQQLDRLSLEAQRLLEVASVAGVVFTAAAVAASLSAEVDTIEAQCEELARARQLLCPAGMLTWPDGTVTSRYEFTHALYQQVAYERLSMGRRRQVHQRIGQGLEAAYGTRAGEIAAELAEHFVRAHDAGRAVAYLRQAAANATQRHAPQEAIGLLTRGLEMLTLLPETLQRTQEELSLQIALGQALMATKGHGAAEVAQVYQRARELCRQVGETPYVFHVVIGLYAFYLLRAELLTARELGEQLLTLAQTQQRPARLVAAHQALGHVLASLGAFAPALEHAEQGIALYQSQPRRMHLARDIQDPGVHCLTSMAETLWYLGYPDQALTRMHQALTLARELAHPFSLAFTQVLMAILHQLRRDVPLAHESAEAAFTLATQHGFPLFVAMATILRGWTRVVAGQDEAGLAMLQDGLAAYQATGAALARPYFLALLAQAYHAMGRVEAGLAVLTEALTVIDKTNEQQCVAEVHRLIGDLRLAQSGPRQPSEAAAECFHRALEVARQQHAKSLELRATLSLVRLWQQQGQHAEARQLLATVYGWFTEGFATADLQAAQALLAALRERVFR